MFKSTINNKVEHSVLRALQRAGIRKNMCLLMGVSGGPDSLALLYAVNKLAPEIGCTLRVVHLNHDLRGADSDADAVYVQYICKKLDVPCTVEKTDASRFRKSQKTSLEDAARRLRQDLFMRQSILHNCHFVTLGHTRDDQAETVLLHLIRGTGLAGLRGMRSISKIERSGRTLNLIRPLLDVSRNDTENYCRALGLQPRYDASNLSTKYSRNRVRLNLLPEMGLINDAVKKSLVRLSHDVARDFSYIQTKVDDVLDSVIKVQDNIVYLNKASFRYLHGSIQHHLMRRAVELVKGELLDLSQSHVDSMINLMTGQPGKSIHLPHGLLFTVSYEDAFISLDHNPPCPLPEFDLEAKVRIPGETVVGDWKIRTNIIERGGGLYKKRLTSNPNRARVSYKEYMAFTDDDVLIRTRKPGDLFQPLGMSGTKKLQDFMVDAKIPLHWRDRIPLIVTSGRVSWVMGWRIADWVKVRVDTIDVLEIEACTYPTLCDLDEDS